MTQPHVLLGSWEELSAQVEPYRNRKNLLLIIPGEADMKEPNDDEIALADARLEASIVSYGSAFGTDNEQIDADLAREYGDTHELPTRKDTSR